RDRCDCRARGADAVGAARGVGLWMFPTFGLRRAAARPVAGWNEPVRDARNRVHVRNGGGPPSPSLGGHSVKLFLSVAAGAAMGGVARFYFGAFTQQR